MKIIGVNARAFSLGETFGVKEYMYNIFLNILRFDSENRYIFFSNIDFDDSFLKPFNNYEKIIIPSNKIYFDWILLPKELLLKKVDLFLSPQTTLGFISKNIKTISIVHDIGYIHNYYSFIDNIYWRLNLFLTFKKATLLITVSNFTKNEIVQKYGFRKIKYIYHGLSEKINLKMNNREKLPISGLTDEFILCVGSSYKRKNIFNCIQAFNKIKSHYENLILVVVTDDIKLTKKNFKLEKVDLSQILLIEGINKKNYLYDLYRLSIVTIIPSYYEGFGFPLIEAQSCGSIILNSNNTSLSEISNGSTIEFNPFDINNISLKLIFALNLNTIQRSKYIEKGYINIKRFNWEKSAKEYIYEINNI